jgi:hypothetical protein
METTQDNRKNLAAETEAEYDLSEVIPLTHRKTKGIIKDRGYNVTGFVLTREDGDKCIVDMSAVRWLTDKGFFEMMHPPVISPTAEPEAEPVECVHVPLNIWKHLKDGTITAEDLVDAVKKANAEERAEKEAEPIGVLHPNGRFELTRDELPLHLAFPVKLYTRPEPAMKPMAEEEINKEFVGNKKYEQTGDALFNFFKGVRFAEKHHFGMGVNPSDPDSIDLQSRCRGDKR